jgi:hydroxymethylbilane synthase
MKVRIASRESRLALWQAEHVKALIAALPSVRSVEIIGMTTRGDQILDRSLSKVGGKGLFVKELELALLNGQADLAVHSAKDVPMQLESEFVIAGFMKREDPRDALISNRYDSLEQLPQGAVVGTSSLRRQAQLLAAFPHLKIEPLRGNLDTRMAKLDRDEYAAIVLACAGVKRLGLAHRIRQVLSPRLLVPAAGQGALALEVMAGRDDLLELLKPLICADTSLAVSAEREVSRQLGGSCQVPLAAFAELLPSGQLSLTARVAAPDGSEVLESVVTGPACEPRQLGAQAAQELIAAGGQRLIMAC